MPRKRSPHPGVVIRPPRPGQYQRTQIRFIDPDTNRFRYTTVPDGADPKEFARQKSLELKNRAEAIRRGAPKLQGGALKTLVESYFAEAILRPSTAKMYAFSTAKLLSWSSAPASGDDLTLAKLRELRAYLAKLPNRRASTANRDLRTIAAVLEHSRKAGRTPRLSHQDIGDGLQRLKAPVERKDYCRDPLAALEASVAHDVMFGAYVAWLLLTGMRAAEALAVTTESVDFATGLVYLQAKDVKTAAWRAVELQPTPAGFMLAEALVLGRKPDAKLFGDRTSSYMREQRRQVGGSWTFQQLRRTASTYLCSMPNVGLWRAAKSLGHHPDVARKHYAGVVRTDATTLEGALGCTETVLQLAVRIRQNRGESLPPQALVRYAKSRPSARPR